MPTGIFYLNFLDRSISYIRSVWLVLLSYFVEIPELNANSVDPDQMPHSVASDLGLHCLPMSLLWDARLKWVNEQLLCQKKACLLYITQKHTKVKVHNWLRTKANIQGPLVQSVVCFFVCVEVLRPSQPNGVMSSAVSLPNHTFTGQA